MNAVGTAGSPQTDKSEHKTVANDELSSGSSEVGADEVSPSARAREYSGPAAAYA